MKIGDWTPIGRRKQALRDNWMNSLLNSFIFYVEMQREKQDLMVGGANPIFLRMAPTKTTAPRRSVLSDRETQKDIQRPFWKSRILKEKLILVNLQCLEFKRGELLS